MMEALQIDQMLRAAVSQGVAPAIAFAVSRGDEAPRTWFAGRIGAGITAPPCDRETRFDLASLTKPLTTGLWALRLVETGKLALDRPIGAYIDVADSALGATPLWRLMSHTAGLPAHRQYFRGLGAVARQGHFDRTRRALRRMLLGTLTENEAGAREVYSDLGFLLLEVICESVDAPLASVWPTLPGHGPNALHFRPFSRHPAAGPKTTVQHAGGNTEDRPTLDRYAPTEDSLWLGRMLRGEVHDENAWTIGGIAGHAGLFGDLSAVHRAGRAWLDTIVGHGSPLGVSTQLVRAAIDRRWMHPRGTRVLVWDTPTIGRSSSGAHFGRHTIGHLGFTGTSIWIDPTDQVVMVLLTNRVCPTRENERIRAFRPAVHNAGWQWIRSRFT